MDHTKVFLLAAFVAIFIVASACSEGTAADDESSTGSGPSTGGGQSTSSGPSTGGGGNGYCILDASLLDGCVLR